MEVYRYDNLQETKLLLKEYSDLKRLIDSHKKLHSSLPYKQSSTYTQNLKFIRKPSKYKSPVRTNSKYKFSRVGVVPPKSINDVDKSSVNQQKYVINKVLNRKEPTNDVVPNKPQQVSARKKFDSQQAVSHDINRSLTTTNNIVDASMNSRTFQSEEPSCSKSRTISLMKALVQPLPVVEKKVNSKYKLVKLNNGDVNQHKMNSKKLKLNSKYSWCLNQSKCLEKSKIPSPSSSLSVENCDTRPNIVKTKYKLSKMKLNGSNNLSRKSPRLIRRVNKYSVKYLSVPQRQKMKCSSYINRYRSSKFSLIKGDRRNFQPKFNDYSSVINRNVSKQRKSELVVIGGIFYKSSKNKLSRAERCKAEKSFDMCHVQKKQSSNASANKLRIVTVRGVKFAMDCNRKVLRRLPTLEDKTTLNKQQKFDGNGEQRQAPHIPTRIDIGGETYIQTRPGVLIRSTATHTRTAANRILNRSIYRLKIAKNKAEQYCMFYNKFGKCSNKESGKCPYIHDPDKIAVCKRFLRGDCSIQDCPFAHKLCRTKMPVCTFFLHGRCSSDSCNYRHVNVNPNADICMDFAKGYCPLGEQCKKWHVTVCQQFEQSGQCERGEKCPLIHKRRIHLRSKLKPTGANVDTLSMCKRSIENPHEEETTQPSQLPSFISLSTISECLESPDSDIRGINNTLQIKPDFKKQP